MQTNVRDVKRYMNQVSATNVGERCNVNRYTTRTHRLENSYFIVTIGLLKKKFEVLLKR
jgi:hypothetical protein